MAVGLKRLQVHIDPALDSALRTLYSVLCTLYSVLCLFQVGLTVLGRPRCGPYPRAERAIRGYRRALANVPTCQLAS